MGAMPNQTPVPLGQNGRVATILRDGGVVGDSYEDASGADVVVEFRDPPLLAREAGTGAASLEERHRQFQRDLDRIAGTIVSNTSPTSPRPRIKWRYTRVFSGVSATIPEQYRELVLALDYVAAIHADRTFHAQGNPEPNITQIGADQVWSRHGTRGAGVSVAVIDTGIDYRHPALGEGFGPWKKVAGGYDFVYDDQDPMDDNGHGTHVAGIIAGDGTEIIGVAPEATLYAYKVLNAGGSGSLSKIIAAIERTTDPNDDGNTSDRVDVVNLSLGAPLAPDDPLVKAVETATRAGIVFCVAAGNRALNFTIGSPAAAPSAITVGAVDSEDEIATFSSRGPSGATHDIKPEVVAPGVSILSSVLNGGVQRFSGTSMATPHVAGAAALLLSLHPDWTPAKVKSAIVSTSTPLGGNAMTEGAGRLDALAAADVATSVNAPTLAFGRAMKQHEVWRATKSITLRNDSSSAQTYEMTLSGNPAGVSLTGTPSQFTLEAGASREATIEIAVDSAVGSPEDLSMAITGIVQIAGSRDTIRIPWAVLRAHALKIRNLEGEFEVTVTNERLSRWMLMRFGQTEGDALVPSGTFEVVALTERAFLVFENVSVEGDQTLNVANSAATHTISTRFLDESGGNIATASSLCNRFVYLEHPDGMHAHGTRSFSLWKAGIEGVRTNAVSDRYRFTVLATCHPVGSTSFYFAQFPVLRGIDADRSIENDPAQWLRQDIRFEKSHNSTREEVFILPLINVLTPAGLYADGLWQVVDPAVEAQPIRFFMHRQPETERDVWLTGYILSKPDDTNLASIESAPFRVIDGRIVTSRFSIAPPPTRYVPPPGSLFAVGDGPIYPNLSGIFLNGDLLAPALRWAGSLDEVRVQPAAVVTVRDASGNEIAKQPDNGRYRLPAPGIYTLEVSDSSTSVSGTASVSTLTQRFDTRLPDFEPPVLTEFRIVDTEGVQSSRVYKNTYAELLFAAADYARHERPVRYQRIRSEKTAVWWRVHGTSAWQPLAVTEVLEDADATRPFDVQEYDRGLVYRVPLSAATRFSGAIDLRIAIEDASGNFTEWAVEPGLVVEDTKRRRAVR